MRAVCLSVVLLFAPLLGVAAESGKRPPPGLAAYFDAARRADGIENAEARCLAYPDLPGNAWVAGAGKARCALLRLPGWTFGDVRNRIDAPERIDDLDTRFAGLMDAHYRDPSKREQVFIQYQVFDEKPEAMRVAAAWVKARPGSPYARTALALALVAQGSEARGTRTSAETSAEALQAMASKFGMATSLLVPVVQSNPRLLPACHALAVVYRHTGAKEAKGAIDTCLKADPASFFVVQEWMTQAEPRWGGSEELMRVRSGHVARYSARNPMLHALSVNHLDAYRLPAGDHAQVLRQLGPLAKRAPNARLLRMVGNAHFHSGQDWEAYAALSQALRFAPESQKETANLAKVLRQLGYPKMAQDAKDRWSYEVVTRGGY